MGVAPCAGASPRDHRNARHGRARSPHTIAGALLHRCAHPDAAGAGRYRDDDPNLRASRHAGSAAAGMRGGNVGGDRLCEYLHTRAGSQLRHHRHQCRPRFGRPVSPGGGIAEWSAQGRRARPWTGHRLRAGTRGRRAALLGHVARLAAALLCRGPGWHAHSLLCAQRGHGHVRPVGAVTIGEAADDVIPLRLLVYPRPLAHRAVGLRHAYPGLARQPAKLDEPYLPVSRQHLHAHRGHHGPAGKRRRLAVAVGRRPAGERGALSRRGPSPCRSVPNTAPSRK